MRLRVFDLCFAHWMLTLFWQRRTGEPRLQLNVWKVTSYDRWLTLWQWETAEHDDREAAPEWPDLVCAFCGEPGASWSSRFNNYLCPAHYTVMRTQQQPVVAR